MARHANTPLKKNCPFLQNDRALDLFFDQWQSGTLPKTSWTHAAHVAVGTCLAFDHPPEEAFRLAKSGILHFNESAGTANTATSGYHETLTRFWSGILGGFVRGGRFRSRLEAVRGAVHEFGEARTHHLRYYSFDVVKDRRARREWIPPDRAPAGG
jgi:hypothetical protein